MDALTERVRQLAGFNKGAVSPEQLRALVEDTRTK
jgi:hypothetical protein